MNESKTIEIPIDEYQDLLRAGETLDWLQRQGVCWRGADNLVNGWRIGETTEWHYSCLGNDIRDLVDKHKLLLANVIGEASPPCTPKIDQTASSASAPPPCSPS